MLFCPEENCWTHVLRFIAGIAPLFWKQFEGEYCIPEVRGWLLISVFIHIRTIGRGKFEGWELNTWRRTEVTSRAADSGHRWTGQPLPFLLCQQPCFRLHKQKGDYGEEKIFTLARVFSLMLIQPQAALDV